MRRQLLKSAIQRPRLSSEWSDADYLAKLISRCTVMPSGCWEIDGARNKMWGNPDEGYGAMSFRGKSWIAHRLSYFLHKGPITKGMDVRHTCDNPPCCNPAHLVLGTRQQNIRDCLARRRQHSQSKTHCPRGHAYADHARYFESEACLQQANPWRACKVCQRISQRKTAGWPEHLLELPPQKLGHKPPELIAWLASSNAKASKS